MIEMQTLSEVMPHNQYFKSFAKEHQRQMDKKIENTYGKNTVYSKIMVKNGIKKPFKQKLNEFLLDNNLYR